MLISKQHIRSYVKRGRITTSQKAILAKHQHLLVTPDQLSARIHALCKTHHFTAKILEIGFGNGESLALMARQNPQQLFIAIEVHLPGVARLLGEIVRENLFNVLILPGDAYVILKDFVAQQSLDRIQIFFPDPWPKKAHHKRRLINPAFVDMALQILKPKARLHLATDWKPYAEVVMQVLNNNEKLVNTSVGFAEKPEYRPVTKFERAGLRKQHESFDIIFELI